ncbi:ubiquitin-like small modifier protein 1 [Candidatus Hecatella orcuttiae]|jgi:MoaD family protein|uniref:ubiquitin-like small modifier protein 1 n=1 Tax=Candidatus Hecatella orcuttiae TaxID=1935119 RepID=UPI002867E3BA|nr:ubiquitin-like small modifier protein 1 [Candidatus Hecatella orcuttiae]
MGKVKISFPSVFTALTRGEREVEVSASSLREALSQLVERYGEKFKDRVFDQAGNLRRLLNIYVNGKNIRHLQGLETALKDGDEVSVLPAVSGG